MKYFELFENEFKDEAFENKKSEIIHLKNQQEAIKFKFERLHAKLESMMGDNSVIDAHKYSSMSYKDKQLYRIILGSISMVSNKAFYAKNDQPQINAQFEPQFLKLSQMYTKASERIRELTVRGMSFCFTGYRDVSAEQKIRELGGKIATSVINGLDFLVAKDPGSTSGKAQKARSQGTKVIGAAQLANMLRD
jgi:NAD-dependent DNA ligase